MCIFYLLGVSIEFLCFPRPEEPIEHVMSCLQALFTLLESPCAKAHIAQDQVKSEYGETTREKEENCAVSCFGICIVFLKLISRIGCLFMSIHFFKCHNWSC